MNTNAKPWTKKKSFLYENTKRYRIGILGFLAVLITEWMLAEVLFG